MKKGTGITLFIIVMIALIAVGAGLAKPVFFAPIDGDAVVDLLTPLFLLTLFSERIQEVYVEGWRSLDRAPFERVLAEAERKKNADLIKQATRELGEFKLETRKTAFLTGLAIGVVLAVLGIRVLEPLTDIQLAEAEWEIANAEWAWLQSYLFHGTDIILTAGLLAGGSDGIHQVIKLFLDFVNTNRKKLAQSAKLTEKPG